jgi:predicted O-methyltransferase YrrM
MAVLATGRRAAEIGTLYGDGAEALAATAASVVTVEPDEEPAARARERVAPEVEVVFVDGGGEATSAAIVAVRR